MKPKRWVQVLALREIGEGPGNGRTQALADYSLTRAKMCELLAKHDGKKNPEEYFFAGMFSLIDVIMKRDWDAILQLIPLSDEVAHTVKGKQTEITPYLQLAEAVERFDWQRIEQLSHRNGNNTSGIEQMYVRSTSLDTKFAALERVSSIPIVNGVDDFCFSQSHFISAHSHFTSI